MFVGGAVFAAHIFKDDAIRADSQAGMITRNLAVLNDDIAAPVTPEHEGTVECPAAAIERAMLGYEYRVILGDVIDIRHSSTFHL